MLRSLYQLVLRAHPPYFRQRFAEEMQCIFDHADSGVAAAGLLGDGVWSLLRQWSLRPQFWEEAPLVVAVPGTPLFSVLDSNKPRTAALIYGAVLSALVLNGVCWTWAMPGIIRFLLNSGARCSFRPRPGMRKPGARRVPARPTLPSLPSIPTRAGSC